MGDEYAGQQYQQFFSDINTRIRDLEDRQRLLKDRMLLVGQTFVKERESSFGDLQEMKTILIQLQEDQKRIKDMLKRFGEQLDKSARKEELMILQRQFDLFREK
ncbi:MAG: hypothetical protein Q7S74_06315 [Nanoarchaeota archaeon]|nr:hypothetical protein [Nanoarchaeota archaeon]